MSNTGTRVWDVPLRLWHWLLGVTLSISLATGWWGGFDWVEVHQYAGFGVIGLLVFRLTWALWGGLYARWYWYKTSPQQIYVYFRRRTSTTPHTAPGVALVVLLVACVAVQATTGLVMTDDIFFEAPFHRVVSDEVADFGATLHHRMWWFVTGLIAIHLSAQLVYGVLLRDPLPLSMITGRKALDVPATPNYYGRAVGSLCSALVVVAFILNYSR